MVAAAIPALASFLGSAFAAIAAFFAKFMTKRIALVSAGIAMAASVWLVFYSAVQLLISAVAVPFPFIIDQINCFIPSNAVGCISAILTAHLLRWVYEWKIRIIQWQLNF